MMIREVKSTLLPDEPYFFSAPLRLEAYEICRAVSAVLPLSIFLFLWQTFTSKVLNQNYFEILSFAVFPKKMFL